MTREGKEFKRRLERIDEEIAIIAGKPLDELTPEEKVTVITKWTIARSAPAKISIRIKMISEVLGYALCIIFFSCLICLSLKWLLAILGVLQ